MSTSFDERISALLDGELTEFETRRVTGEVLGDSALKDRCQRYMLAGDVIKDELPVGFDSGFADRVMQAIDEQEIEEISDDSAVKTTAAWKKPLAGAAIAASVAALALVSLQTVTGVGTGGTPAALVANNSQPTQQVPQSGAVQFELTPSQTASLPSIPSASLVSNSPRVTTVSSSSNDLGGVMVLGSPVVNSEVVNDKLDGYLTTHSEFASRSGVISRARVLGFTAEPATVKQAADQ